MRRLSFSRWVILDSFVMVSRSVQVVEHPASAGSALLELLLVARQLGPDAATFVADLLEFLGQFSSGPLRIERQLDVAVFLAVQLGRTALQLGNSGGLPPPGARRALEQLDQLSAQFLPRQTVS